MPRRSSRRELEIVGAIAGALNSSPTVQQALERTLQLVTDLLGLETGWVWLVDSETEHIYSAAAQNLPPYLQEPVRMTGGWCWCIEQFRNGSLTPSNVDVMECTRLRPAVKARQTDLTRNIAHHASVPLSFQGKPLGIMNITAPSMRRLTADELRLLGTIGLQVGVAIERARLAEEMAARARSEERTGLAREIHDTMAQDLTALALQIETALRSVGRDPDRVRERLEKALTTARASLDDVRRSVTNLRARTLAGKPLPQAIAAFVRQFTSETGIRVTLDMDDVCELKPDTEAELYRIAQQALINVRQHARARQAHVKLRCAKRSVTLTVADDGVGFDPRKAVPDRHGIKGMRERARLAGGSLRISSGHGTGTRIAVKVKR
jgi:two-component system NarL family sensor kinase